MWRKMCVFWLSPVLGFWFHHDLYLASVLILVYKRPYMILRSWRDCCILIWGDTNIGLDYCLSFNVLSVFSTVTCFSIEILNIFKIKNGVNGNSKGSPQWLVCYNNKDVLIIPLSKVLFLIIFMTRVFLLTKNVLSLTTKQDYIELTISAAESWFKMYLLLLLITLIMNQSC